MIIGYSRNILLP